MKILQLFSKVEKMAVVSKLNRFLRKPLKYSYAIATREIGFKYFGKSFLRRANSFFQEPMFVELPSGTDIFLTGGKTDNTELRLTRFLIHHLKQGDHFLDIGAHFGFYTLLAAHCIGKEGKVIAVEASAANFRILSMNCMQREEITIINKAVSNQSGQVDFFEFPSLYSEYNSTDIMQFHNSNWLKTIQYKHFSVETISLDELLTSENFKPIIVKIDTEGSEEAVIKSGLQAIAACPPSFVIMEFLSNERSNLPHRNAAAILYEFGYQSYVINADGTYTALSDIPTYLTQKNMDSDNIVFKNTARSNIIRFDEFRIF